MVLTQDKLVVSSGDARAAEGARTTGLLDLRGFLGLLRRRARLILLVATAVMTLVVAALVVMTPRYTASNVLIVDPRQQRVLQSEAVLPGIGQDAAAVESQVEVIQSTTVANAVIKELDLASDPEFSRPSLLDRIVGLFSDREVTPQMQADRVLARFADALRVTRRGLTYVLEIRFTAETADKAARIANAVADAYVNDQSAAKNSATSQAAGWIGARLDELRRRVTEAERAVATFKGQNNIVDTGEGRTLGERQVSELNQQLILARARTAEARARLDQVGKASAASVGAGSIPEVLMSPVIANLRSQYAEAARREAETTSTLGPRHPAVATMRAQMSDIRSQIEREIARVAAGIRNEYEAAQSRERSLERSLADLQAQSARTGQANVRLRELEREAQASRTLLEQALLRYRETSEQEGLQRPDARVLSPATPPLKPSEPKTLLMLLVGLAGSLVAGIGSAAAAESLGRGFRTTREVEASLSIPVVGLVPMIDPGRGPARRPLKGDVPEILPGGAAGRARRLSRYGVDQPLTAFGEAIRTVRTRLAADRGSEARVLTMLSAVPGEGKSTVAVNLAHSFAKSGLKTLLVDVDVRKPSIAAGRNAGDAGVLQMLGQAGGVEQPLFVDPVSGLSILPLGRTDDVAAASELLTGPAMRALLDRLRSRFEMVVLDGPPLLPFVDGRNLLELSDAGLLVVEWNRTDADKASAAVDSAGPASRKISGIVLNKVDLKAEPFVAYGQAYGNAA